ncbi:tagaturonate reductase [Paenactinomyces guangxiensis]|uniref:Tagaturonate reductase n=1 Tax=Paenactinomyces guangxiensis TaxID=1490290 RepID=A0A7W2A7H8_9BACL|nr:tagaturonate reductase [Paenactinomyces guangxiensis]MBA4494581.1 tagaturonate reductase [Paenactinomyces guangxiensis]MBH8591656.1 tagaturonate reductase [Paenactinomyces guangxiensis]
MERQQLNLDVIRQAGTLNQMKGGLLPEKVLQFGEGNFLRGFVDWMIHRMNMQGLFHGSVVAVQPTPRGKVVPVLNAQDGLYTVVLRGIDKGNVVDSREVISCISRGINPYTEWEKVLRAAANPDIQLVFSNTTEAGLEYQYEEYDPATSPRSFPGKLTACLYHRFKTFQGAPEAGWSIIPCELVDNNGEVLQERVLQIAGDWHLPGEFTDWVKHSNRFCNTLVDRIVTGFPKDNPDQFWSELGYRDDLITVGEPYHLFAIEADPAVQEIVPFHKAGLQVYWSDVTPFRELKVRILNGAHTMMAVVGHLHGKKTVLEVMETPELAAFIKKAINEEILPCIDLEDEVKKSFAQSVLERFQNPFNRHYLLDISLNSVSKFKARVMPTLSRFMASFGSVPFAIAYSLASLFVFYKPDRMEADHLIGKAGGEEYPIRDHEETLRFMQRAWQQSGDVSGAVKMILANGTLWGENLNQFAGLTDQVSEHVSDILQSGARLTGTS